MKFKKLLMAAALTTLVSIMIVGCGKAKEDSLSRVRAAKKLTVVGSGGYPPFNFIKDGKVVGFDVDTGEEIAKRLGVQLNYVTSDWDGLIEGLRSGRYDGILGSMAITDERQKVVDFTVPYYYSGAQLFVKKDSGIKDTSEMKGKTIAVATGTSYVDDVKGLGAEPALYQDDNATFMELLNGRVDGVITDRLVGLNAVKKLEGGNNIVAAGNLLRTEEMGIAINKNDKELREEINKIIKQMHEDGTLKSISEKWMDGVDVTVK
ncbi:ABC transporter substrate-binding protein [Clostridium sp.]|uniref:ABC transporter substrate-binding protein n=1 Tax=Clostridium sp. TaxID=1506 RepID=UPI002621BF0B|nr:ABC transporter substrate-binding protein [Clostridium sp.]